MESELSEHRSEGEKTLSEEEPYSGRALVAAFAGDLIGANAIKTPAQIATDTRYGIIENSIEQMEFTGR